MMFLLDSIAYFYLSIRICYLDIALRTHASSLKGSHLTLNLIWDMICYGSFQSFKVV